MTDFELLTYCVGIADTARCALGRDKFVRLLTLAGHEHEAHRDLGERVEISADDLFTLVARSWGRIVEEREFAIRD
jgi:hypothetical protein